MFEDISVHSNKSTNSSLVLSEYSTLDSVDCYSCCCFGNIFLIGLCFLEDWWVLVMSNWSVLTVLAQRPSPALSSSSLGYWFSIDEGHLPPLPFR